MKKLINIISAITLFLLIGCSKDKSYPEIIIKPTQSDNCEITTPAADECGYLIYDPDQSKTVKAFNMRKPFIPASVTKLYTSVMSLELLHPDYKFTTELLYSGSIKNGVIEDALFLKGGGNPELSIHDLTSMIYELKSRGIKNVKGHFYYDIELFDSKNVLNKAMPVNAKYNPGFGPLNLNGNTIHALKKTDQKGRLESCELFPALPSNSVYLYDGPDVLLYAKYSESGSIETWGLPSHGKWENRLQLPVKNTGLFTASNFRMLCSIHGITLPYPERGITASGAKTIISHNSRELSLILKDMLYTSDNLTSELIGTTAFKELCERNNNPASIRDFFCNSFPSINWDEFNLTNYSGLTDINRATPEQTVAMLIYLSGAGLHKDGLSKLLPLSGLDGTMKSKFDAPDTAFRIYAKTGSIYYASALAGEFIALSGKKYLFSVFINNKEKRRQYSSSGSRSIDAAEQAEKWSTESAKAIELFIDKQIKEL